MASMNEMKDQQKAERMKALNSVIDTEIRALWARMELYVLQANVPIEEGNGAIPWLLQCHIAEIAREDEMSLADYMDEAKRAYDTVQEEENDDSDGDDTEDDDDDDGQEELQDALDAMKPPSQS